MMADQNFMKVTHKFLQMLGRKFNGNQDIEQFYSFKSRLVQILDNMVHSFHNSKEGKEKLMSYFETILDILFEEFKSTDNDQFIKDSFNLIFDYI